MNRNITAIWILINRNRPNQEDGPERKERMHVINKTGEREKKRMKKKYLLVLVCVLLLLVSGCKKKAPEPGEESISTPTAAVVWEGFEQANQALVKQRAEAYANTIAVSVGDMDISMEKAMFLIFSMEVQGNSQAAYFEAQYGEDYWGMVYDEEGRTTRDVFKEETMEALIQYAVLHDCAEKNGMELTADELKENLDFVETIKSLLSAEETERGGFTTENLRETCNWMMLGEKYYGMMTDNLGITRESVEITLDKADYKEYETEYLYLPTTYYDEEYNICEEADSVKEARMAQMQDYYEQVLNGSSFEALKAVDEELVHNTRTFLEKGEGAEKVYKDTAALLENGEICSPIQTEYGIYIIRMVDDQCTKSYEAAVDAEYELKRSEAFQAAYEVLLAEYEVTVNEEAWGEIILGATVSLLE